MSDTDQRGTGVSNLGVYEASSITVLEGLAPVRKRPGMYIGNVEDGSGLHHLLWEVLSNAIDPHLAGKSSTASVTLGIDGSVIVEDDGPGISIVPRKGSEKPFLEEALTTLHLTATLDGHAPHVHVGGHGIGVFAVNAVSARMMVETTTGGRRYRLCCERGVPTGPIADLGPIDRVGTVVTFWPDPAIFTRLDFEHDLIAPRLRELSALMPRLTLSLRDERTRVFASRSGLADLLDPRRHGGRSRMAPVWTTEKVDGIEASVALLWCETLERPHIYGYVNSSLTPNGTHVTGLLEAFCAPHGGTSSGPPAKRAKDFRKHLLAAVSVFLDDPSYAGEIRHTLLSPEATDVVRAVTHRLIDASPELRKHLGR